MDKSGGVKLVEKAFKDYLSHYDKRMEKDFLNPDDKEEISFRNLFRLQAEKLEKSVMEDIPYEPFLVR